MFYIETVGNKMLTNFYFGVNFVYFKLLDKRKSANK